MKISEVVQRVQSLYSKGVDSDDSRLEDRHIYNKLVSVRSKLLHQKVNKKQKINQWSYQTIPCFPLEETAPHECPCLPPVGCKILKSKFPLPEPLSDLNRHVIQSVTSIDGSVQYDETLWSEKKYSKGKKYTSNKLDFFLRNNYLYITHRSGPELVAVTALFQDPLEAASFASYCDDPDCTDCADCESYYDKEFRIDSDLIDTMIEMSANELINVFSQIAEDQTNNTKDTEEQRSK